MLRPFRPFSLLAVVLLLSALLVACGGDDESGLSKSEYVSKADAICKKGTDEINEKFLSQPKQQQFSGDEEQQFTADAVLPAMEQQLAELKELEPSSDYKQQVDEMLASLQSELDKAKADPSILTDENTKPFATSQAQMEKFGLTTCSVDF